MIKPDNFVVVYMGNPTVEKPVTHMYSRSIYTVVMEDGTVELPEIRPDRSGKHLVVFEVKGKRYHFVLDVLPILKLNLYAGKEDEKKLVGPKPLVRRRKMKKVYIGLGLGLILLAVVALATYANSVNRSPDATFPHSPELNHTDYWGENCRKYESGFDGDVGHMPAGYTLLVLKAGRSHFVWYNPAAGDYGTPTYQDISHSIVCRGEVDPPGEWCGRCSNVFDGWVTWFDPDGGCDDNWYNQRTEYPGDPRCYEECSKTTGWILVDEKEVTKPNGNVILKYFYEKYDKYNSEAVCDTMVAIDRIPYEVCSGETFTVYGDWSEWFYKDGKEHRTRTVTVYDAVREEICNQYVETDSRCKDLFRMWLLWDANGRECYIISGTHPSVERQQTLCFPCSGIPFTSVKSWSGMVDSCDNWELDKYRGFERLYGEDLLNVWKKHKGEVPRCNVECE